MPLLPKAANTEGNKEGQDDRSVMAPGDYLMHIVKTEFKETKKKDGHYLACQLKVIEGENKGRVVFINLNLDNPNPVAVEIANKELNSICQACGLEGVEDSDELLNIPMSVKLKVKKGDAQWPDSNETVSYAPADEFDAEAAVIETIANADVASTEAEPGELPWNKK